MTHLETLKTMRDFYDGSVLEHPEKVDALTAAIAAMEAINKSAIYNVLEETRGLVAYVSPDFKKHDSVLIIPAAALKEPTNDN